MDFTFLSQNSLFRKLFVIILLISLFPMIVFGVYSINVHPTSALVKLSVLMLIVLFLTIMVAAYGAYQIARRITLPITQFKESATEIARGNFSHKIEVPLDDEVGRLAKIFNYMTTELRRLNEMNLNKIITEKNKTQTIIKNIADGVIVTDPRNKILVINSVAEQWFEINEGDVFDTPIEIHFNPYPELLDLINNVREQGNHSDVSVEIHYKPKKNRKEIVLQAKAARVVGKDGKLIGIVTIFRDITREKEIDRMKTELVSMVAHELRSPLTSISGFSELLLDSSITKDQSKEYAEIILTESSRLGELINKFLDISRIEAGKSQVHKVPLNMCYVIHNIVEMNIYQANKKKIDVHINVPEDVPQILADKEMMEEVSLNLFSNAIKYSPPKTNIYINAQVAQDELILEFKDEGFGISEESLGKIFDKFYRVTDNDKVKDITGSGLGLSLVKEIIETHHGSIWVESELGKGSSFFISLPIANDTESFSYLDEIESEIVG
ncbi:HAMP domain-containing protein [candidate division KSB1 bacterium]|nr:HAMP domain-containing protein [candidate division KSB1 bacterium]